MLQIASLSFSRRDSNHAASSPDAAWVDPAPANTLEPRPDTGFQQSACCLCACGPVEHQARICLHPHTSIAIGPRFPITASARKRVRSVRHEVGVRIDLISVLAFGSRMFSYKHARAPIATDECHRLRRCRKRHDPLPCHQPFRRMLRAKRVHRHRSKVRGIRLDPSKVSFS